MCGNVRSLVRGCHHWGILSVSLPAVNVDESTTSAYMERLVEGFVQKERGKAYSLGVWGDGGKGDTQCGQLGLEQSQPCWFGTGQLWLLCQLSPLGLLMGEGWRVKGDCV